MVFSWIKKFNQSLYPFYSIMCVAFNSFFFLILLIKFGMFFPLRWAFHLDFNTSPNESGSDTLDRRSQKDTCSTRGDNFPETSKVQDHVLINRFIYSSTNWLIHFAETFAFSSPMVVYIKFHIPYFTVKQKQIELVDKSSTCDANEKNRICFLEKCASD